MKAVLIAIVVFAACIYPSLSALSYGVIFVWLGHFASLFSVFIGLACILLFIDSIKLLPTKIYLSVFIIVLVTSSLGFFIHFQDSGESGPLPFEWLNNYWKISFPLLFASAIGRFLKKHTNTVEQGAAANP
jgi:hypothetical protein